MSILLFVIFYYKFIILINVCYGSLLIKVVMFGLIVDRCIRVKVNYSLLMLIYFLIFE